MKEESITYANKKIEKLCTDKKYQSKKLPQDVAKRLRRRLHELRIAENVLDLMNGTGKWHPLSANLYGLIGADVKRNKRIILRGIDEAGKSNQWHECRAVQIVEIDLDYH